MSCRVTLDTELVIDSRDQRFESDLYTGKVNLAVTFCRTNQQAVILEMNAVEIINAWAISAWLKYASDQGKRSK